MSSVSRSYVMAARDTSPSFWPVVALTQAVVRERRYAASGESIPCGSVARRAWSALAIVA
jgi:hypothetical protein